MIGKFFSFIGNIFRGLGLVIGSIITFVVYGLIGYFILWVTKTFSLLFISFEWITNEYVQYFILAVFEGYKHITELVLALGFGIVGVVKIFSSEDRQEY